MRAAPVGAVAEPRTPGSGFDPDLVRRYGTTGPRYTSYPTADRFDARFTADAYCLEARLGNEAPIPRPLSLYFHIPFCATLCFYCACNKVVTKNRKRAEVYLDYLLQEIQMQGRLFDRDREVVQLHLGGGTPTFLNLRQIGDLLEAASSRFSFAAGDDRDYSIEIDPRTVSEHTLAGLRELGFNRVSLGVQDFDPEVQKAVHRVQSQDETIRLLRFARRIGFRSINMDLIYGLPKQTVASFGRTLEAVVEAAPDRLSVYSYAHLPERFAPQRRIRSEDLPGDEEKLRILGACVRQCTEAGYVHIGMDHFARPDDSLTRARASRTLHRNFQGYTTHGECDLVGMGVSAISEVQNCYSQNEKDLDAYYAALDGGRLPVCRGLALNRDDRIRRDIIRDLMCYMEADLDAICRRHGVDANRYFRRERDDLRPLEADDLVRTGVPFTVTATPAGRFLVRRVCMVFDRHLRRAGDPAGFSRVI